MANNNNQNPTNNVSPMVNANSQVNLMTNIPSPNMYPLPNEPPTPIQKLGMGFRKTFGLKKKTAEEKEQIKRIKQIRKEEINKRRVEEKTYKQIITQRQKEAWQVAYKEELANQRQMFARQKEAEAIARAKAKAKQDVFSPKPTGVAGFLTGIQSGLQSVAPAPSKKVEQQLSRSVSFAMGGNDRMKAFTPAPKKQQQAMKTYSGFESLDFLMGTSPQPNKLSAQAISQRIKHHHKHQQHLKHLGTAKGGMEVSINGTKIVLGTPKKKYFPQNKVRHQNLKSKLKKTIPSSNAYNDLIWKS